MQYVRVEMWEVDIGEELHEEGRRKWKYVIRCGEPK